MNLVKHIPNTITCLNLISGALSIKFAFAGEYTGAFAMMLMASVFDFCDGFAARLLKAYSDVGKELDSLADVISFGLAPSLILFTYLGEYTTLPYWVSYTPLIIAALSAVRLAKFNLDTRQSSSFIGLPTPANGLFLGALVAFAASHCEPLHLVLTTTWITPVISLVLALLLVSEVPMFSLKLKSARWSDNKSLYSFVLVLVPLVIAAIFTSVHWTGIIALIFFLYILWNTLQSLILPLKK